MEFVNRIFENTSIVFKKEYLTEYTNDPRINRALNGVILLNYDDFFNWYNNIDKNNDTGVVDLDPTSDEGLQFGVKNRNDFLEMANVICSNIGGEYGISTLDTLVQRPDTLDFLVAVTPDYLETNITNRATKNRYEALRNKILGFIIIEKGECKKSPELYCLRLICTKQGERNDLKIKGSILVGAFLYCLKSDPSKSQIALLELADRYQNLAGFFAYSKFGFGKDTSLYSPDCFYDNSCLPMSVNLYEMYSDKEAIIGILSGTNRISDEIMVQKDITNLVFTGIPKNEEQRTKQTHIADAAENLLEKEYNHLNNIKKFELQIESPERADKKPENIKKLEEFKKLWMTYYESARSFFQKEYQEYRSYDDIEDDEFDGNYDISPQSIPRPPEVMDIAELPQGWIAYMDQKSGNLYYYNSSTGVSTWTKPVQEYNDRPTLKFSDLNVGGVKKRARRNKITKRANKKKSTYLIKLQNRKTKRNKLI